MGRWGGGRRGAEGGGGGKGVEVSFYGSAIFSSGRKEGVFLLCPALPAHALDIKEVLN